MAEPVNPTQSVIACVFTGEGVPFGAITTLGVSTPPGGWTDDPDLLPALGVLFGDFHQTVSSSAVRLLELRIKRGPSATGPTFTQPVSRLGDSSSSPAAANNAYLIKKEVSSVSGRFAGRMFWPGVAEQFVDGAGNVSGSMVEAVNLACDELYQEMWELDLPSQVLSGTSDSRPITRLRCDGRIATQRRRMRR